MVDLDGIILEANPAFSEIFISTAKELEGVAFADLLLKDDQPAVLRELGALSRGERSQLEAERRFRSREGAEIWARATTALIRNRDGDPDHLIVMLDDVSETVGGGGSL